MAEVKITQAQLAQFQEVTEQLRSLGKTDKELRTLFKAHRNNVEEGKLKLHIIDKPSPSTKYAEVVKEIRNRHPELGQEVDEVMTKHTKDGTSSTIQVTET